MMMMMTNQLGLIWISWSCPSRVMRLAESIVIVGSLPLRLRLTSAANWLHWHRDQL